MSPLISHLTSPLLPHLSRLPAWTRRVHAGLLTLLNSLWRASPARGPGSVRATLPSGQATRLTLSRGETLIVRHGCLWLTREGDSVDHLLQPGSGHVASVPQDVVIEALGPQACCYERHRLRGA